MRWTTLLSSSLVLLFVAASVAVHPAQPLFNPFDVALSFYMNGAMGWLLTVGLISLGAGSLLLGVAIQSAGCGQTSRSSLVLLALWAAGCVVGGMFPPDAYGQWNRPPSPSGITHSIAAMVAFVSFPSAALSLSRLLRIRGSRNAGVLRQVAVGCAIVTVLLFICLAPGFLQHRPPIAFGLVERLALAGYVGWLLLANLAVRTMPVSHAK